MAKTRNKQEKKGEDKELKIIKPLKPLEFKIPTALESIKIKPLTSIDFILGPKRTYGKSAVVNEKLSTVLWLEIYKCLDENELVKMLVVCHKLHMVANDDKIRLKLFCAKQDRSLHNFQTNLNESKDQLTQSSMFQGFNRATTLAMVRENFPAEQEIYNPGERGFILRKS